MSDALKRVLDAVSPRGDGLKKSRSGWEARCPAHEDREASLSIGEGQDGRVLLNCHAGCDHKSIVAALGLEERDLFNRDESRPASTPKATKKAGKAFATADAAQKAYERTLGQPSRVYEYEVAGELVGRVIRWDRPDGKKDIRPISRHADGWRLEHMIEPRPLYLADVIAGAPGSPVCVAEGEKCVQALSLGLGVLATTSSGGSNAASKTDWSPLAGREVVILPDADEAGRKYADEVASILLRLDPPATVGIVELDGLEPGGDVADLHEACRDADEVKALRERIERLADEVEPLQAEAATPDVTSTSSPAGSSSIPAWQPFPASALPPAAASLVEEAARAIGCDEAFVALPLLAVLGSAIGTTRRVELKPGWTALPIVWPVTVAESGSHKSPAADVSLDHVREREDRLHEEYLSELADFELDLEAYEKARTAWRQAKKDGGDAPPRPKEPLQRRVLVEDATVEALVAALADNPRGLLVATDELTGWLDSFGRYNGTAGSDEAFYLKAYSGRSHNVSRRTGRRSLHVRQAAVWITGTIQPGVLARSLGVERRESGFLARLLLAAPPRRPKKWTTASVSWSTTGDWRRVLDNLYGLEHELVDGRERSRIVRLSRDAETLFVRFFHDHDREALQYSGDLAAAWSKLEEVAGRLALIVHETRLAAGEELDVGLIDEASMAAGIELVEWFKYETRRVYRLLAESAEDRVVRQADERLAAYVAGQGGTVAVRDVIAGCRWIRDARGAEEALQRLVAADRGVWRPTEPGEAGGRPGRLFELQAEVVSAQPPKLPAKRGSADADACRPAEVEVADEEEYVEL
jgi:hypothetical protein